MRESLYGIDSGHPQAELRNALHLGPELLRRSAVARALAKGALIDAPTMSDGSTLLMVACSCGHTDRVRLLCEFGADVGARRLDGATALWCTGAEHGQHQEAMALLLGHGAEPKDCGPAGASLGVWLAEQERAGRDAFGSLPQRRALLEQREVGLSVASGSAPSRPLRM